MSVLEYISNAHDGNFKNMTFTTLALTYKMYIGTRTLVRVTIFENANYKKSIFQELISRVLLEIETRGRVFCISTWANGHLYIHQNNWITIFIL